MSGGMCQRAMLAMALSAEPSLLIADEPTTGLDATIQSRVVDLLAELKAETGVATILISHDISVIQRLSDRIAVMYGGTVVETGRVEEVLAPEARRTRTRRCSLDSSGRPSAARAICRRSRRGARTIEVPRAAYGRCSRHRHCAALCGARTPARRGRPATRCAAGCTHQAMS
jgi:ABC-type dipeptide/oligopeptide/nickel transport system ATPase component